MTLQQARAHVVHQHEDHVGGLGGRPPQARAQSHHDNAACHAHPRAPAEEADRREAQTGKLSFRPGRRAVCSLVLRFESRVWERDYVPTAGR